MKVNSVSNKRRPKVTFATSVYEKDWRNVLQTGRIEEMISACNYQFDAKLLVVNNIEPEPELLNVCQKLQLTGVLDIVLFSNTCCTQILNYFEISNQNLHPGYNYLIQNLTALYFCPSEYLLWFTCDSIIENNHDWILSSIDAMNNDDKFVVANPNWNTDHRAVQKESSSRTDSFFIGYGFSDQCCLLPVNQYRQPIYHFDHPDSERYPLYAGFSFERRIDSWMRSQGKLRLTHAKAVYNHTNFI